MVAVVSVGGVLLLWRFMVVFGTTVSETTGLSPQAAGFETRSALVGAGYTTSQSERVVRNPAARRAAGVLVMLGYFGPATVLALLGVGFVIPTNEDLTRRTVVFGALLVGLFLLDRLGIIRAIGVRPARAVARRWVAASTFEAWIDLGDHIVASLIVPSDSSRAQDVLPLLDATGIQLLAIDRGADVATIVPTGTEPVEPRPGDRIVVFGQRSALEHLQTTF
jgi:hypothetical protein